jgi:hypothetical protein
MNAWRVLAAGCEHLFGLIMTKCLISIRCGVELAMCARWTAHSGPLDGTNHTFIRDQYEDTHACPHDFMKGDKAGRM